MGPAPDAIIVRVGSHRARAKLIAALGRVPQGFFIWSKRGEFRAVTPEELPKLRGITGITCARVNRDELRAYLTMGS